MKDNGQTKTLRPNAENAAKGMFFVCAFFSVVAVFGIVVYLLVASIPAIREIGFFDFVFRSLWNPKHYEEFGKPASETFGVFPMLLSSLVVTFGAVFVGGFLGICTAVFLVYYCPRKCKGLFHQMINLLSGIPSVVYGFFGLVVIIPALETLFRVPVGNGVLAAILVLSLMILPTVASLTKNSLDAVPKEYYEGALALGNSKAQAIFNVCIPAAKTGIFSALILGVGRAVGETMAVQMVVGGSTGSNFPTGFFVPVATLTTHIVTEMGYSSGLWKDALIATGFLLLVFILLLNLLLTFVQRERTIKSKRRSVEGAKTGTVRYFRIGGVQEVLKYGCIAMAMLVVFALGAMVVFVLAKGIPNLTPHFLFSAGSASDLTLLPMLVTTLMIVALTLLIALPLGIGAAIYLNEYAKKGGKLGKVVRLFFDTLAGIPSIVFGLFGMIFFVSIFGGRYSILAGSFTMVLIVLPTVERSVEESLRAVPDSVREGSLALGASKVRTIFRVVLPSALGGIATSIVLSIGRIVGESAALIFTAGAVGEMPSGYLSQGMTFAVAMYKLTSTGLPGDMEKAYATAVVLLFIVVVLNFAVSLIERKMKRKALGEK